MRTGGEMVSASVIPSESVGTSKRLLQNQVKIYFGRTKMANWNITALGIIETITRPNSFSWMRAWERYTFWKILS